MTKPKYLIFTVLFIFFSAPLFAKDIIIERLNDKLHFAIYPTDNKLNYYVLWFPFARNCAEIDVSQPLLLGTDNMYRSPKNGGYLCIIRSEKPLDDKWIDYQIKPNNKLLSFIEKGVNPGHLPNTAHDLPFDRLDCSFTTVGQNFEQCELQL